jgi:D-alanyl-lipoteichoic acid acyltransferase DltB (MBOAT superfamily)
MLFNSYEFLFAFLPVVFFIYFYLNKMKLVYASKAFLVFSSLFFYSWWNIIYLPLILSSILFNYIIGDIARRQKNRMALVIGIVFNILLLIYFKYFDFFIENINVAFDYNFNVLNIILPLAISFFTFQQIAYLVDSYKSKTKEYNFLNYALFVTFFPQLIAGPIVHHKEMMHQFSNINNKIVKYKNLALGLFIFIIGLFKKVVIADTFSVLVNNGYSRTELLTLVEAWTTSLSYTFQLYFDFSGYTDMAIGIALLFNIKLPMNFNSPYKAINIQDFWRRWHITLSRFLRDYIYIPLGGNKNGNINTYSNLLITFIVGGFWHGAGWTFLFWGFLHGLALTINRVWQSLGYKINNILAWFITFNFVNITWVFFRAEDFNQAVTMIERMFFSIDLGLSQVTFFHGPGILTKGYIDILFIICAFIIINCKNSIELKNNFLPNKKNLLFLALLSGLCILFLNSNSEFLYFRF